MLTSVATILRKFGLLLTFFTVLLAIGTATAQTPPLKVRDFRLVCVDGLCSWQDFVTGQQASTYPTSIETPSNSLDAGFTVAVQLTSPSPQATVETVFSLLDPNRKLLFSLLRDNNGRWYVGKVRDNPSTFQPYYISKPWDPVSPCTTKRCSSDTIYASFQSNGQIQLDEVALIASSGGGVESYSWKSGLLNFGYPLSGYNVGSLTSDPTAPLQQQPLRTISIFNALEASTFSSPPILGQTTYPGASLNRIAIWISPGSHQIGVLNNANQGIMRDQQELNAASGVLPQLNWLNCDSGQYEQPKAPITSSTQYWSYDLPTPCNVPSVPLYPKLMIGWNGSYTATWTSPSFPGVPEAPGGTPSIVLYHGRITGPGVDYPFQSGGNMSTGFGLVAGKQYTLTIAAEGAGGSRITDPTLTGLSPAAVVTATAPILPGIPTNVTPTPIEAGITTSWNAPGGFVMPSSYTVNLFSRNNIIEQTTTVPSPTATFHGLTPSVDYHVSVQANNQFGSGTAATSGAAQALNPVWIQCATEHGTCAVGSTPQLVNYHPINAPTSPVPEYYKMARSNLGCNNDVFGDPYDHVNKVCLSTALVNLPNSPDDTLGLPNKLTQAEQGLQETPGEWTYCAPEGGTCYLNHLINGQYIYVAYGAYGSFKAVVAVSDTIACTNSLFTDPAVGRYKACFFKPVNP